MRFGIVIAQVSALAFSACMPMGQAEPAPAPAPTPGVPTTPPPTTGAPPIPMLCDDTFAMDSFVADNAARAMGICSFTSARITNAGGLGQPQSTLQMGLLPEFGSVTPPQGRTMLALSSGVARAPTQRGYTEDCDEFGDDWGGTSNERAPIVSTSAGCGRPGGDAAPIYDSIALEVVLQAPQGATGFKFNSNFFTYEYPEYICNEFNDYFAALRQRSDGSWENLVFDQSGSAVSVNNSLLEVCVPGTHGGRTFACPQGSAMLNGTGFGGSAYCGGFPADEWSDAPSAPGGATGWLETVAPVTPGETVTLRFTIWDAADTSLDSTVLIDGFEWIVDPVAAPSTMHSPLI